MKKLLLPLLCILLFSTCKKPETDTTNPRITIPSIKICDQVWMVKNLDVATYRNGDPIPKVTDDAAWSSLTTGAYCYFNNDSATYAATYGKLYNWYAVNDPRGLAPAGWHVPSDVEFITLAETCLGGWQVAGGKMKEIGTTHWASPNEGANNNSGFTGLPGGNRYSNGTFDGIGIAGNWWSSTLGGYGGPWFRVLISIDGNIYSYSVIFSERGGYSVRCIRD